MATELEKQLAEALKALCLTDEIQDAGIRIGCNCKLCMALPKVEAALNEYSRQNEQRPAQY